MDEHKRIYRIFQLIARLRTPLGSTKQELANDFEVNIRTIERYFKLLRELGFDVVKVKPHKRYRIENISRPGFKPEDLIVFTLEEAAAVKEALLCRKMNGPLQKSLLDKLYALTDLDELSETIFKQNVSKNISNIRFAIKNRRQIKLKGYQSVNGSEVSDRLVEPLRFYAYYRYLLAWENKTRKVKQYKTERIAEVELTNKPFLRNNDPMSHKVDIFGMSGNEPIKVKLYLSRRARMLMEEEFPEASLYLNVKRGMDCFEGEVYSLEGIGRFVLGLIDEVEVSAPRMLKEYISHKVKKANLV